MTSTKNQRIVELIGLVGVIGSLVFVGLEVRQSTLATKAATDASVADSFRELNLVMASSPELAEVLAAHAGNPEEAPRAAQIQMLGLYRAVFHIWSNAHRQHLNGTIDPALYGSIVQELSAYAGAIPEGANVDDLRRRNRMITWAWQSERFLYNPDFQRFVDDVLASSGSMTDAPN